MSARPVKPPRRSSWRDIQQGAGRGGPKPSRISRQRKLVLLLRSGFVLFMLVAVVSGVLAIRYFSQLSTGRPVPAAAPAGELVFQSDGVLSEAWFREKFGGFLLTEVRQVDVGQLKLLLEQEGQVASASVGVRLPRQLVIGIREREPILRVRVRDARNRPQVLLLARDGTLYRGSGYPQETLRRLPGAAGLKLRREGEHYAPIEGIQPVASLLDLAKERLPLIYRHWRVVDLSDWDPSQTFRTSLVRVRSSHIEELVFAGEGLEEQIQQLAGILEHTQRYQMGLPRFIDLSFKDEVVIRYN
jgi:hypothetical protein